MNIADEIYAVPGIDAIFVGPNDLTYSMRSADGTFPDKATFEATLTRIREAAKRQTMSPAGCTCSPPADALRRAREGWQFIAVNSELKMMLEGAADLTEAGQRRASSRGPGQVLNRPAVLRQSPARLPDSFDPAPDDRVRVLRPELAVE